MIDIISKKQLNKCLEFKEKIINYLLQFHQMMKYQGKMSSETIQKLLLGQWILVNHYFPLPTIELTMSSVEEVMRSRDKYKSMMQKTNEALQAYVEEIKRMRKFLLETGGAADIDDEYILYWQFMLQSQRKYIKEGYVETQLENSENLRLETQTTIETLREEFDLLVKELAKYKKKDSAGPSNADQKGSPSQQQNPSNNLNNQNFGMNENYAPSNNIRSDQKNKKDSQSSIIGTSNAQQSKKDQEGSNQNSKGAPIGVPKLKLGK
ncbi:UNKNOWN [Stylonychia lemnae]|uniref:Uncharacterized protein n=1 Tax=Stylonychia lemnae TaxID=5949 RepID=A0A078A5P0_STYLE|nr:UNKNOWN [Stylonychia lemnae]|eukprot:CDW76079.1 UNKNOWN [Stylonychia lemnae]